MRGEYTKRKLNKLLKKCRVRSSDFCRSVKRFFVKHSVKSRDFTIISNNCWAGRVYSYLGMPYLTPTAGLYFFAEDYIKFVGDLKRYLDTPLQFIDAKDSRYYQILKQRNQLDKPIGILRDVEIVFLHYKSKEEALEKWNRRKARVNFDNIILKFSPMNMCEESHLKAFDELPFENKLMLVDSARNGKYKCAVYYKGSVKNGELVTDTEPFPGTVKLKGILDKSPLRYPTDGLK